MLLSYFFKNSKMAEESNVFVKEAKDSYVYCLTVFKDFYKTHMTQKDKKMHKYVIMCFCYDQKSKGRMNDFEDRFLNLYKTELSNKTKVILFEFVCTYDNFIDYILPGVKGALNIIYRLVEIVTKELGYLLFKNLMGENFQWSFYRFTRVTRNVFDLLLNTPKKFQAYSVEQVSLDKIKKK